MITKAQTDYTDGWVKKARAFFEAHVPKDVPKKVVYPFAGGDLSTALTVYPDADEITTISLEPAGDPRTLAVLKGKDLEHALGKVEYELKFLYRVNFSNTMNMIEAMRGGALPTQLIFGLSALKIHGYELVGAALLPARTTTARSTTSTTTISKKAPDPVKGRRRAAQPRVRERRGAVQEARRPRPGVAPHPREPRQRHEQGHRSRPQGGSARREAPRGEGRRSRHDEGGELSAVVGLVLDHARTTSSSHVVWMVSDATGVAPKWGKPAGFEYETYGDFVGPHIQAGNGIAKDWAQRVRGAGQAPAPVPLRLLRQEDSRIT